MSEQPNYLAKQVLSELLNDETVVIIDVRRNWNAGELKIKSAARENPDRVSEWLRKYDRHQKLTL